MSSPPPVVERTQPWLGTLVAIRVTGADPSLANRAIDAAFAEIAAIHDLMSFHQPASDLSRLNRHGAATEVRLDPRTAEVLAFALDLARRSDGAFDPAIASRAVANGDLPAPAGASPPDPEGSWRDVVLDGTQARLLRPVWLDLGGVAKGYAVDRAVDQLRDHGVEQACVNAGGDLRVLGDEPELVRLRAGDDDHMPVIEISDGALASSGGDVAGLSLTRCYAAGRPIPVPRFASVAAPKCMAADALTKVVLAGIATIDLLGAYGARAWIFEPADGWRSLGEAA